MRTFFVLFLCICAQAQAGITELDGPVRHVELHPNGARISRSSLVMLPEGSSQWVINDLPSDVPVDSMRIGIDGGDAAVTRVQVSTKSPDEDKTIEDIDSEIAFLRGHLSRIKQQIQAEEQRLDFYLALAQGIGQSTASNSSEAIAQVNKLADESASLRRGVLESISGLNQKAEEYKLAIERAEKNRERRIRELSEVSKIALIWIESKSTAEATIEVSYWASLASWNPAYSFRLQEGSKKVTAVFEALIQQSTGMDWGPGTEVTLCNLPVGIPSPARPITADTVLPWHLNISLDSIVESFSSEYVHMPVLEVSGTADFYSELRPLTSPIATLVAELAYPFPERFGAGPAQVFWDGDFVGKIPLGDRRPGQNVTLPILDDPTLEIHLVAGTHATKLDTNTRTLVISHDWEIINNSRESRSVRVIEPTDVPGLSVNPMVPSHLVAGDHFVSFVQNIRDHRTVSTVTYSIPSK
jgi:hypothetical protein